jgi:hypothetical protein
MKLILFYIFVAFSGICFGQQLQWLTSQTGIVNQLPTGNRISTSKSGESHVVATFSGQAVIGANTLVAGGYTGSYFAKFNSSGTVLWTRKITSSNFATGEAISVDKKGNVFVTGKFATNATFDTTTITTGSVSTLYVAKYDQLGTRKWIMRAYGTGGAHPFTIKTDSLSNSYISGTLGGQVIFGTTTLTGTGSYFYTLKLDSLGNVIWLVNYNGNGQGYPYDLAVDKQLNIFVAGHFQGQINIGTYTLNSTVSSLDLFLLKLDINGNPLFAKKMGGAFFGDRGLGISFDGKDHLYIAGGFEGSAVFDTYTVNASPSTSGNYAGFIAKYDLNGNCRWAKKPDTLITSQFFDVHCGDPNAIYVAGEPLSSVIFKFDSLGKQKWFYKTNSSGGGSGFSLSTDQNGSVYMHSTFNGTLSSNISTLTTGSSTVFNNFVGKLDTTKIVIAGISENLSPVYSIFPNPGITHLNILPANDVDNISYLEIYSVSGAMVNRFEYRPIIDIEKLPQGLYIIRFFSTNGQSGLAKFVKE